MYRIIQGDNFSLNISSPSIPVFDGDYTGAWAIVPELGSAATVSGTMSKSGDQTKFQLRITPAQTAGITPGRYYLCCQVSSTALGFKREVLQAVFQVLPQGIV